MYKILICFGLIYTITASSPRSQYYLGKKVPPDVDVFYPSAYPGVKVPDPEPLPPRNPTQTTPSPTPPSKEPYTPTYPKKPPSSTKKPFTTKIPPIYSWTSKKPLNFPPPIYPSSASNNTPSFTTTYQPPRTYTTSKSTYPSTRWPANPPKTPFFPTSQSTPSTPWQPKYPSTVASGSGATGTPAWIYPPRPSWPRPSHLVSGTNNYVTEAVDVEDGGHLLTGSISEYEAYNEDDGSFKLGFELRNGLSAKVHGYKKNGKLVLEGSYSIFTEDGKPINIIYKADENNYQDSEPTIFHLDIPSFDQSDLDDENDEDANPVPTYVPYRSNNSKILTVDQSGDDGQFSDLILEPTTQQSDDEIISTTETSNE